MVDINLHNISIFSSLSDEVLAHVDEQLEKIILPAGQILFNVGDKSDQLFIIEQGRISIFTPGESQGTVGQKLNVFTAGKYFGQVALITGQPRAMIAKAEEDTTLLALSRSTFKEILGANPDLALSMMKELSLRVRYAYSFLQEVENWIRKISSGDYEETARLSSMHNSNDQTFSILAAEFALLASKIMAHDATLQEEVAILKIQIDESRHQEEVEQIRQSVYYQELQSKLKDIRSHSGE